MVTAFINEMTAPRHLAISSESVLTEIHGWLVHQRSQVSDRPCARPKAHSTRRTRWDATPGRASDGMGTPTSAWAWVTWIHQARSRSDHKIILVRASSLRPLEPPEAYKAVRGLDGQIRSR